MNIAIFRAKISLFGSEMTVETKIWTSWTEFKFYKANKMVNLAQNSPVELGTGLDLDYFLNFDFLKANSNSFWSLFWS